MSKFEKGQTVAFTLKHADGKQTRERGIVIEHIGEGPYIGQYRIDTGWLAFVQPEDALSAA